VVQFGVEVVVCGQNSGFVVLKWSGGQRVSRVEHLTTICLSSNKLNKKTKGKRMR
jgi:hypothetical protein